MKKLLLLSALFVFACTDDEGDNNNSNQSNYFFEFELFDVVNRVQGDYNSFFNVQSSSQNICLSGSADVLGWGTVISIGDISDTNYISGQNFYFSFVISDPQIGNDNYTSQTILFGNYIQEQSPNLYFSEIEGDFFGSDTNNKLTNIIITDLGEVGSISNDMQDFVPGDSFKATYEKMVYFASQNSGGAGFVFNIPTLMRFEINSIRGL
tara:strand:+ start:658 stop:1284 length:627 start_codon:yes stop_codon:yes gene_type:complete